MPRTTQNSIRRAQVSILDVALGLSVNIAPQIQIDRPSVTAVAVATSKSTVGRLLELPPELRNRIFELAVMMKSVKLRIAWTNKQLHDEILPLFYGIHLFRFTARHFISDDGHIQPSMLLLSSRSREQVENTANPVPESSLICFGFSGRETKKGGLGRNSTPSDSSISEEGEMIELPTFSLRKLLKRIELILLAPDEHENTRKSNIAHHLLPSPPYPRYTELMRDWLYPLHNLRELGFGKLSELSIIIRYPLYLEARHYLTNEQEIKQLFKRWVAEQVRS
ncbi:hypothetical protein LTS10_012031 [Elasticomyces elasticus]|nr:hypothetical protein LTS10_012031 [Elasticomyces elasticus]